MKNVLLISLLTSLPLFSSAKVEPEFEGLLKAKIECTVVSGTDVLNNQVRAYADPNNTSMIVFDQIGGADYTDARCFNAPALSPDPAKNQNADDKPVIGSCFSLDSKTVRVFNSQRLTMKDNFGNKMIDINFATGHGRFTQNTGGCDWGRDCFKIESEVRYENCTLR